MGYFCGGFIFANFVSQSLRKLPLQYTCNIWLFILSNENITKSRNKALAISHLTLFHITQEAFHLICSFKNYINKILFCTIWVGILLQLNIIFIIKTAVLLNRVLGKKRWHFPSIRRQGASFCVCCFYSGIYVMHWCAIIGLLTKSAAVFSCTWFHKLRYFTVQLNNHSKCA